MFSATEPNLVPMETDENESKIEAGQKPASPVDDKNDPERIDTEPSYSESDSSDDSDEEYKERSARKNPKGSKINLPDYSSLTLTQKLDHIKTYKKARHLGLNANYLDKLSWSPKLNMWLYYSKDKGLHIIANVNSRLIDRGNRYYVNKEPTKLSQAEMKLRCSLNSFVFATQSLNAMAKSKLIKNPDDFITKFLGFTDSPDEINAFRNRRTLSSNLDEEAVKAFQKANISMYYPDHPKASVVPQTRSNRKTPSPTFAEFGAGAGAGAGSAETQSEFISLKRVTRSDTKNDKSKEPKHLFFFGSIPKSVKRKEMYSINESENKIDESNKRPKVIDLSFFGQSQQSDNEVSQQSQIAREERLFQEAQKQLCETKWIINKLNPAIWTSLDEKTLGLTFSCNTTAKLTAQIINKFCEDNRISLKELKLRLTILNNQLLIETKQSGRSSPKLDLRTQLTMLHQISSTVLASQKIEAENRFKNKPEVVFKA